MIIYVYMYIYIYIDKAFGTSFSFCHFSAFFCFAAASSCVTHHYNGRFHRPVCRNDPQPGFFWPSCRVAPVYLQFKQSKHEKLISRRCSQTAFPWPHCGVLLPCCDKDARIVPGEVHRLQPFTGLSAGWLLSLVRRANSFWSSSWQHSTTPSTFATS